MRRTIDIAASTIALLAASPVILLVAIAVLLESPGNPFYGGWRVGKDGAPFRMWKFRTMVKNAARAGACITGKNDPRITRVGRILRKTKLDELPQFLNVLFGHMTLVGPRPESPEIVALYTPRQRAVLAVRPGVTGRVQLESGEESDCLPEGVDAQDYYVRTLMHDKLARDLQYLQRRTPLADALIVLQTATYVLRACLRRT